MRYAMTLVGILLLCSSAWADTWGPPQIMSFKSPSGRFRLRVIPARIPEGRRPSVMLPGQRQNFNDKRLAWCQGILYDGTRVVRTVHLCNRVSPLRARVSDDGRHIITFDNWGYPGHFDDVVAVYLDGQLVTKHAVKDLLTTEQIARVPHTSDGVHWFRGAWIEGNLAVVVGEPAEIRTVDLVTGRIATAGEDVVMRALSASRIDELAVELATERRMMAAVPVMRKLLIAGGAALRVRAAIGLAVLGDARGKSEILATVRRSMRDDSETDDIGLYAVRTLPEALGLQAVPLLRKVIRGHTSVGVWTAAFEGLARSGSGGTAALIDILRHDQNAVNRSKAASTLSSVKDPAVLPHLLDAVREEKDDDAAYSALTSAIELGGPSIAPELAALLKRGSGQDRGIATYFAMPDEPRIQRPPVRFQAAVPALIAALRRHPQESEVRASIVLALEFQTGANLGIDPAAWERWQNEAGTDAGRGRLLMERGDMSGLLYLARTATDPAGRKALIDAEMRTPRLQHVFGSPAPLAATYTTDGRAVVISHVAKPADVWSADEGNRLQDPDHRLAWGGRRYAVDFDHDVEGTIMGAPDARKSVRVLNVENGRVTVIHVPQGVIRAVMGGHGTVVVTHGADGTLRLFDPASGHLLHTVTAARPDDVWLDEAAKTALIVHVRKKTSSADFKVVDVASGIPRGAFSVAGEINDVRITPDGRRVVLVDRVGTLRVFAADGTPCGVPQIHARPPVSIAPGEIDVPWTWLYLSPDGSLCATARDSSVRVWTVADARSAAPAFSHTSRVHEVVFNPTATLLMTVDDDGRIHTWDLRTGQEAGIPIMRGRHEFDKTAYPSFAPDGHHVALSMGADARTYDVLPDTIGVDDDAPAELLLQEAELWTGWRLDGDSAVPMTAAEVAALRTRYAEAAQAHAASCRFRDHNRWLRDQQARSSGEFQRRGLGSSRKSSRSSAR